MRVLNWNSNGIMYIHTRSAQNGRYNISPMVLSFDDDNDESINNGLIALRRASAALVIVLTQNHKFQAGRR